MKTNYHTHNYRCNHAVGTVEEYIEEAIKEDYDEIGISDHLPHPGKNIDNRNRMAYEDLKVYFKEIDDAKEKYRDKISVKKAIECEYFEDYHWLYDEFKKIYKVDYLLLGVHFFPYKGEWLYVGGVKLTPEILECYIDYVIESMESGYFAYIAHPDLFAVSYRNWDEHSIKASRRILEAAEKLNMPLEININGFKRGKVKYNLGERYFYPVEEFWNLSKEYNVKRILGVDAHEPEDLRLRFRGEEFAKKLNLEIIDRI